MGERFLREVSARSGAVLPLVPDDQPAAILDAINGRRETRLLFDELLTDDAVQRLLSAQSSMLSPVELFVDELKVPGELRGPIVRFFPVPVLFDLHGDSELSETDFVMAASSASVDAKILWDHIDRRMRPWMDEYGARMARARNVAESRPAGDMALVPTGPSAMPPDVRAAYPEIDPKEFFDRMARAAAYIAGAEGLPLLKSLPLLSLGTLAKVALRHREAVSKGCELTHESYSNALRRLAAAHVTQVGVSMFCCSRHQDYPFAFLASGQSAPPAAMCGVCGHPLPGITSYHFEPGTFSLLTRPGGILEVLAWRVFESGRIPYAPRARIPGTENEFDVIFASKGGGYGIVECKGWLNRAEPRNAREQLRQALVQLQNNVELISTRDVPVDCAILVTNRYGPELEELAKSVVDEHHMATLKTIGVKHLGPGGISQLGSLGRPKAGT